MRVHAATTCCGPPAEPDALLWPALPGLAFSLFVAERLTRRLGSVSRRMRAFHPRPAASWKVDAKEEGKNRQGVLKRRSFPLERAAARVCCEAGARVATDVFLRDLNLDVPLSDGPLIEVGQPTRSSPLLAGAGFPCLA